MSLFDIVNQLARTRGIKENVIFKVEADGDEKTRIDKIKNIIIKSGSKKL